MNGPYLPHTEIATNGPKILARWYGPAIVKLQAIIARASQLTPSIVILEIDLELPDERRPDAAV